MYECCYSKIVDFCVDTETVPLSNAAANYITRISNHFVPLHSSTGECMCPPEFAGPHCEFLKLLFDNTIFEGDQNTNKGIDTTGTERNMSNPSTAIILSLVGCAALLSAVWWKRRQSADYRDETSLSYSYEQPVFPLASTGYHGNDVHDAFDEEEYVLQDVTLT